MNNSGGGFNMIQNRIAGKQDDQPYLIEDYMDEDEVLDDMIRPNS